VPKREITKETPNKLGAAHLNPADAYRGVPILKRPVWNHEIAAYFYLGGISAGSAVIGSLAELFNSEQFRTLARTAHYVSFATILPCPLLLIDDLGVPSRFHHMLRVFKPASPMNLGAWAFAIHGVGATLTVGRILAEEGKLPVVGFLYKFLPERLLVTLGIPSSLVLAGYTGVLLGTTSVPVWQTSPLLGALFNASAFSAGTAAVSLASQMRAGTKAEHEALSKLALISGVAELSLLGGYIATSGRAAKPYREGETGAIMAGAIGASITASLLEAVSRRVKSKKRPLSTLASISALIGGALLRWAVVRAGKASATDRELTLKTMKPRESVPGWGTTVVGSR
jgi:formate-dependent nitrite reductase membrane component NrfD